MVLPVINFSGVNKVIYSGQEMSKVYCGSQLVWEKKVNSKLIVMRIERQASMYSSSFEFTEIDPRISTGNIDKIVLMEKYTIKGSDVTVVIRTQYNKPKIKFKSDINSLTGFDGFIQAGAKLEVYLK